GERKELRERRIDVHEPGSRDAGILPRVRTRGECGQRTFELGSVPVPIPCGIVDRGIAFHDSGPKADELTRVVVEDPAQRPAAQNAVYHRMKVREVRTPRAKWQIVAAGNIHAMARKET